MRSNKSADTASCNDSLNSRFTEDTDNKVEISVNIEDLIQRLKTCRDKKIQRLLISEEECQALTTLLRIEFLKMPMVLELEAPIKIVGDIHGQFFDLIRMFEKCGYPPNSKYVFLGDYVDRGKQSVEVICFLFCLKYKYPDHIFMLRGNHESSFINRTYGFKLEIKERYETTKAWKRFNRTFNVMPVAAIVESSVFCCHGGLSQDMFDLPDVKGEPKLTTLTKEINKIVRPTEISMSGLLCDLLWADPHNGSGFLESSRGCSQAFGQDIIYQFLNDFDLDLVIRGHEVVERGYEFFADRKLTTLFSAPRYCGEYDNRGAVFNMNKDAESDEIVGSFSTIEPDYTLTNLWYRNIKKQK